MTSAACRIAGTDYEFIITILLLSLNLHCAGLTTEVWTALVDMCDSQATDSVFEGLRKCLNAEGKCEDIEILVANADNMKQGKTLLYFSPEAVREAFDANIFGGLNVVRAYLRPEVPAISLRSLTGLVKDTSGAAGLLADVIEGPWRWREICSNTCVHHEGSLYFSPAASR
ncbi:Short-chain dehydrogenase/reductase SDR [Neofusicoccum parvum]|nr:Short-chain dehydrogenase/reductase SDR [Neofusicoccum parvum]